MIPAAGPAVLPVDGLESVLSKFPVQGGLDLTGDQMEEMQTEAASHAHTHTYACASHCQSRITTPGPSAPNLDPDCPAPPRLISS